MQTLTLAKTPSDTRSPSNELASVCECERRVRDAGGVCLSCMRGVQSEDEGGLHFLR